MNNTPPLNAPRILCLHGGGTNAAIFKLQLRTIISLSSPSFRYIFVEAPFVCPPHPAIVPYFSDLAPFRRWLRWLPDHEPIPDEEASTEILKACRDAMEGDKGTGEWVGILGFSQGAKIGMSLLWGQQMLDDEGKGIELLPAKFKFGVLHAGRNPIVSLSPDFIHDQHISKAGDLSSDEPPYPDPATWDHALRIPTVHVHGLKDPGLESHRVMRDKYCAPGSTRLVEWDGDHRLPVKTVDVEKVLKEVYDVAASVGVDVTREGQFF